MEKVRLTKLTKEQARAIESQLESHDPAFIVARLLDEKSRFLNEAEPINQMVLDTLIRALYIGYEVEQTPEDKVRECFENETNTCTKQGMLQTLTLLDIKIKGVNDK